VFTGRFDAEVFVEFLKKLVHDTNGPIFLVLDNHSVHKARVVRDYVDSLDGRLKLFFLPPYSPELNPDEWVWKNVKVRHEAPVRREALGVEGGGRPSRRVVAAARSKLSAA
jgi:transposase